MILQQPGIFDWNEPDKNLVLTSLLTGECKHSAFRYVRSFVSSRICRPGRNAACVSLDPLLLIGNHGLSAFR